MQGTVYKGISKASLKNNLTATVFFWLQAENESKYLVILDNINFPKCSSSLFFSNTVV